MNLMNLRALGAAFGCLIDKDFNNLSLFAFRKQHKCTCKNCNGRELTESEELERFLFDEARLGKITKEDIVEGKAFTLTFEDFCVIRVLMQDKNPPPLEILFSLGLPHRKDIVEHCKSSSNMKEMSKELLELLVGLEQGNLTIEDILENKTVEKAMTRDGVSNRIFEDAKQAKKLMDELEKMFSSRGPIH